MSMSAVWMSSQERKNLLTRLEGIIRILEDMVALETDEDLRDKLSRSIQTQRQAFDALRKRANSTLRGINLPTKLNNEIREGRKAVNEYMSVTDKLTQDLFKELLQYWEDTGFYTRFKQSVDLSANTESESTGTRDRLLLKDTLGQDSKAWGRDVEQLLAKISESPGGSQMTPERFHDALQGIFVEQAQQFDNILRGSGVRSSLESWGSLPSALTEVISEEYSESSGSQLQRQSTDVPDTPSYEVTWPVWERIAHQRTGSN